MVRITIPAQLTFKEIALNAAVVDMTSRAPNASSEARDEVLSALSEALNNVVLHAYRGVTDGTVELEFVTTPWGIEIRISDQGKSFDPSLVAEFQSFDFSEDDPDSVAALPEGGMGLFIMRSFMDELTYASGNEGRPNVMVLRKHWARGAKDVFVNLAPHPAVAPAEREAIAPTRRLAIAAGGGVPAKSVKKETAQSGWRIRGVAVPESVMRTAGSLKRK